MGYGSVHARRGGEEVVVLREPVVGGESDELGATPKHPAEEVEGVECVGEVDKERNHHPILDDLLAVLHLDIAHTRSVQSTYTPVG